MTLEEEFPFGKAIQYHGPQVALRPLKLLPMTWDDERDMVHCAVEGYNEFDGWYNAEFLRPPQGTGGYVDGNPKTAASARKPPLGAIPGPALLALGLAMKDGEAKYGLTNWREHPVTASTYLNAMRRHILEFVDGQTFDKLSGVNQLGHVMACCAIIIDAMAQGTITDDRTKFPGMTTELINQIMEGIPNAVCEPR